MIVDLNVSSASKVVTMAHCPNNTESICGILYRAL